MPDGMGGVAMRTFLLVSAMVLTTASPAKAQEIRTYICSVDAIGSEVAYQFGTGELRIFDRGAWSHNWCGGTAICKFDGPRFVGGGGKEDDFQFIYDISTGRYARDDIGGRYAGTCRLG